MVNFVGAGPGAEDLITVRGQRLIREADVIIYAGSLVNPALLKEAGEDCLIYNSAYMTLDEVISVMQAAEEKGLMTVRLHTGDPSVYGAIREQIEELKRLGIEYSICPGVSSFFAAAAALGIEYTIPEVSQSVIITRAEGRTAVPVRESLKSFAAHNSTMVIFLSAALADKIKDELIEGGLSQSTPVAVVYKASWPDERKLFTTLGRLPETMEKEKIKKTALIIVGNVLGEYYGRTKLYDKTFSTEFRKA